MNTPSYQPISCDFHDLLEVAATRGLPVQLEFVGLDGAPQRRHARIVDVYSRSGAEYLNIDTGETVRLDRLISVERVKAGEV